MITIMGSLPIFSTPTSASTSQLFLHDFTCFINSKMSSKQRVYAQLIIITTFLKTLKLKIK